MQSTSPAISHTQVQVIQHKMLYSTTMGTQNITFLTQAVIPATAFPLWEPCRCVSTVVVSVRCEVASGSVEIKLS